MAVDKPYFEIMEHTADAGVVAHGRTLAEAFAKAAEGMYALMVDLTGVREQEVREVQIIARDHLHLLERWLLELLFLTETEHLLFRRFDVEIDNSVLRSTAYGEALDRDRHQLGAAVKGVTRHLAAIDPEDGGQRVRILFDI